MVFDITGGGLTQNTIKYPINYTMTPSNKDEDEVTPTSNNQINLNNDTATEEVVVSESIDDVKEEIDVTAVATEEEPDIDDDDEDDVNHPMYGVEEKRADLILKYYRPLFTKFEGKYAIPLTKMIDKMVQPDFDVDAFEDYSNKLTACVRYYKNNEKGNSFMCRVISTFDSEYHILYDKKRML